MTIKELHTFRHPFTIPDEWPGQISFRFVPFQEFYALFKEPDIDTNLIVQFEITRMVSEGKVFYEIFVVRKSGGSYQPCMFETLDDYDEGQMRELLIKHWEIIKTLWTPISNIQTVVCDKNGAVLEVRR